MRSSRISAHDDRSQRFLAFVRSGEADHLDAVLEASVDGAFAHAVRLLDHGADAEDAVQEAFLRLVRTKDRYDGSIPFGAWLGRLVHDAALMVRRARGRRWRREGGPLKADAMTRDVPPAMDARDLRQALERLSEADRRAISLHYFSGLSQEDAATALGISTNALAVRLHRARDRLRRRLAPLGIVASPAVLLPAYTATASAHAPPALANALAGLLEAVRAGSLPSSGISIPIHQRILHSMTTHPMISAAMIALLASIPFVLRAGDAPATGAAITLAADGHSEYVIALAGDASPAEHHAADELASYLGAIVGCAFTISAIQDARSPLIAVGPGAAKAVDPTLDLAHLGDEGLVMRSRGRDVLLTGGVGSQRGTLYAVYAFLQDAAGVRWWSPAVTDVPKVPSLTVPAIDRRYVPRFEYRDVFWSLAFDVDWAARNGVNGPFRPFGPERGGGVSYAGDAAFVHSFYNLVPPSDQFEAHPEWFSLIAGKRTHDHAQLCLSNPALLDFVVERVRSWLREHPEASILSVSQNDMPDAEHSGRCTCDACAAIEAEEGSAMGPVLRFVNAVAERIEHDFPKVAIDTLAYQYTRKPPLHVTPRDNVIVRLCSIECSFSQPLENDANAAFRDDLHAWSKICQRLYIWDYTTSFSNYMLPFPDLRVIGPNIAAFAHNGVRGVLEQGNHNCRGADFAELRAWMLAQLLWNPDRDPMALMDEFLRGYYHEAAPFLRQYIDLIHDRCEASGARLPIDVGPEAPFFTADLVVGGERLMAQARTAVAAQPEVLHRVELAGVPIRFVALTRWLQLRRDPTSSPWPFADRASLVAEIQRVCAEHDILRTDEQGDETAAKKGNIGLLTTRFGPPRPDIAPRPAGFEKIPDEDFVDLQDGDFSLWERPTNAEWLPDGQASDGMAAWMPGSHNHWLVYMPMSRVTSPRLTGTWTAYLVARVEQAEAHGEAFTCGVHGNGDGGKQVLERRVACAEISDDRYHVYRIGSFAPEPNHYIWAAPTANAGVRNLWVDRIILVRGERPDLR